MGDQHGGEKFVFLVHYFPPLNSSGAKRVEAISKYLARKGCQVVVVTTRKSAADGAFTEAYPPGVEVLEMDWLGRVRKSELGDGHFEPMYSGRPSWKRRVKDLVMNWFGQLPDPRIPFAFAFLSPLLDRRVEARLRESHVLVGSCPPWAMLLAARFAAWRFRIPCVLDYRDHFSHCHEMPGSRFAKALERVIDVRLARGCSALVTISEPMTKYYSSLNSRVITILNGFDHEVLDEVRTQATWTPREEGKPLIVRYFGIVSPGRVPYALLNALKRGIESRKIKGGSIVFEYYGNGAVLEDVILTKYTELKAMFLFMEALPYRQALALMLKADYLLFAETSSKNTLSASGILTTKMFEYLGSGRPIIANISSDTLAGSMMVRAGSHHVVSDSEEVFSKMFENPEFWNPIESKGYTKFVETLSRAYQAELYYQLLIKVAEEVH